MLIPSGMNYFYELHGHRLAEALRSLGFLVDVGNLSEQHEEQYDWCILTNISEILLSYGAAGADDANMTAERERPALDAIRRLHNNCRAVACCSLNCASTPWYEWIQRRCQSTGINTILDFGLHDQSVALEPRGASMYHYLPNGLTPSEQGAVRRSKHDEEERPIPWVFVGHATASRVALVDHFVGHVDPRGFVYMPSLSKVTAKASQHLNQQQYDTVLRKSRYQIRCARSPAFLSGERTVPYVVAGRLCPRQGRVRGTGHPVGSALRLSRRPRIGSGRDRKAIQLPGNSSPLPHRLSGLPELGGGVRKVLDLTDYFAVRSIRTFRREAMNADGTVLVVLGVVFVATLIRSAFGFGEALVAVPLLARVIPVAESVPLAALLSITVAAIIVVQDWRHIHFHSAWRLVLASLPGIPIGLWMLTSVPEPVVKLILAVVIIGFSTYCLVGRAPFELKSDRLAWLFGFWAGVLGGAYGMNGPPLVIYGSLRRWSAALSSDLAGILLSGELGRHGRLLEGRSMGARGDTVLLTVPAVSRGRDPSGANDEPTPERTPLRALCPRRPYSRRHVAFVPILME